MDYRPSLGAQRPAHQRTVSGGSYGGHVLPKRPPLPSRLSNARSVSQPIANKMVDLTSDAIHAEDRGGKIMSGDREELVRSPDVIQNEEEDGERPAKRMKTMNEEPRTDDAAVGSAALDMAHEIIAGAPMPAIPRARPPAGKMSAYRRSRFGIEPGARKAHGMEAPAIATRVPPPKKVLDFAPWSGNHHEDVLNENVIRNGYYDKAAGSNQSETNTAKAAIWPSLSQKNHAGLSALSYLYVAVMEKRQAQGKCSAPSTFKPPPRLAVQEAKRAKWLEDLADPSVPLRRLSKTIPHGIKGKLLMEQCLGKYIPLQRALWLVRGVGMHELRAFRRKGYNEAQAASNELKWVLDWTGGVTQFLQDVLDACGQPEWQKKMNYAVKLATALFSERLLDADYYLDWIVSSLADSTLEQLPAWTVIAQIHWKSLTSSGRRGRRLAEGILGHLDTLLAAASPANHLLQARLQKLISVLAIAHRGCLISPSIWQKYEGLLSPPHLTPEPVASNIASRSERIAGALSKTPQNTRSAYLDLFQALDSVGVDMHLFELTSKCENLVPDHTELVYALLDWASTRYRTGESRIYLAAAIIAQLQESGRDTDTIVLHYLGLEKGSNTDSDQQIYRVLNELIRLKAFAVGRYLQWLIASGALYSEEARRATRLIAALSTARLPKHIQSTRNMLMDRLGHAIRDVQILDSFAIELEQHLHDAASSVDSDLGLPEGCSMSTACSIAQHVVEMASRDGKQNMLTLVEFCVCRDIIEKCGDISALTTLAHIATKSDSSALLATVADTANYHGLSFAVLGQLHPLVERLGEQYLTLRPNQPLDRGFILALSSLVRRVPGKSSLVKLLADDLILCEQQNTMAACSPASDSVIDMHATNLDSDEDIDAVFASGNVMDEQLMQRVFSRVVQRASKPSTTTNPTRVRGWLEQLRSVDASNALDAIVQKYLSAVITGGALVSKTVIAGLALSGCASFGRVASMAKDAKDPQTAAGLLSTFLSSPEQPHLPRPDFYKLRLEQKYCQDGNACELARLLSLASGCEGLAEIQDDLKRFVIQASAAHEDFARQLFDCTTADPNASAHLTRLLNSVLGLPADDKIRLSSAIAAATPLSIRFSMAIRALPSPAADDAVSASEAISQAFENRSEVWPQLLAMADADTVRSLRQRAQNLLLRSTAEQAEDGSPQDIGQTLDLLALTVNKDGRADSTFISAVIDRLRAADRELSQSIDQLDANTTSRKGLIDKLNSLLRVATISLLGSKDDQEGTEQIRTSVLGAFCSLLINQGLQLSRQIIEHTFDLASALSDTVPAASLSVLKARLPTDSKLDFILGGGPNGTEGWLALATQVQIAGSTQQQRALNKHPSQQKAMARSAGPGPSTASSTAQRGWSGSVATANRMPTEIKMVPYHLRTWEVISDPASTVGENDTALSLGLFGTRKV